MFPVVPGVQVSEVLAYALERVIAKASSKNKASPSLKKVVESILALKPKQAMGA